MRAQTTLTSKVVGAPLRFVSRTSQPVAVGWELPMPTSGLEESTNAPPPSGTVPAGQVAVASVMALFAAGNGPVSTTL